MTDPLFSWKDKVTVITGASAGIGAAMAREVSGRGAKVVLAARRKDKLDEVKVAHSLAVPTDVTREDQVKSLFQAAIDHFGRVDVWVNNAGRGITKSVEAMTDEDLDTMLRDNVKSALYGARAVLPHFKERGSGVLVNVSSLLGRTPFATFRSAYSASKHALNALTDNLRVDLSRSHPGISVVLLLPGPVATDFGNNALGGGVDSRSLPGAQSPQEVAKVFADALEEGREDVYTRPEYLETVLKYFRDLAARRRSG